MSKESASTPRQQRFLEALATLKLEFPVAEISRRAGYAEGTVSPNLKPTTEAPTKFIRRVSEAFNLDAEAIISGVPGSDTKKPGTEAPGVDYSEDHKKYVALLEKQDSRYIEIAEAAANKLADRLLINYATKKDLSEVQASLDEMRKDLKVTQQTVEGIQIFAVERYAELKNISVDAAGDLLDSAIVGDDVVGKKHKKVGAGK